MDVLLRMTLACAAAAILPCTAHAQARVVTDNQTVRLRVHDSDSLLQGVVRLQPAMWHLTMSNGAVASVATSSIRSVEVLASRRRTGRGALIGGLIGAGLGAAIWIAATDDDGCNDEGTGACDLFLDPIVDNVARGLAVLATGTGIAIGAFVGSRTRSKHWVPAELPRADTGTRIPPGSSFSLGLTVRRGHTPAR